MGNWAALYLTAQRGVSARGGILALMSFWALVTLGRVLFAALSAIVPARWIYGSLPILLVGRFKQGFHARLARPGGSGLRASWPGMLRRLSP